MADQDKELKKALKDADEDPVTGEPLYHGPPSHPRPGPEPGVTYHPGSFGNPDAPSEAPVAEPVVVDPDKASEAAPAAAPTEAAREHPVEGDNPPAKPPARARDSKK